MQPIGDLFEVGGGIPVGQSMKEHPLLHRRQRINILYVLSVADDDSVYLLDGEPTAVEIRRSGLPALLIPAVIDEMSEFIPVRVQPPLDRLLPEM